jgi:hypothetical protein
LSSASSQSPPPPASQPPEGGVDPQEIKARYVSAARQNVTADDKGALILKVVILALVFVLAASLVFLPWAFRLFRWWRKAERNPPDPRDAVAFAERAVPVMAVPLMVNSILRRPGTERAPGLFLISFDDRAGVDFMADVAVRVGLARRRTMSPDDRAFCRALMRDEDYRIYRRRKLPPTLTDGVEVYAVDLAISPLLLAGRHIPNHMPLVPCMAEPGDDGRTMQMPYWIVTGEEPPGVAEKTEFTLSLDSITRMTAMRGTTPGSRG